MTRPSDLGSVEALELPSVNSAADAYAWCRMISHRFGANFSVGFRFLPQKKRDAVYAAYAFCRWADDIADEPGDDVPARLDAWQRELERCYEGHPGHPITIALADALQSYAIPQSAFVALIDGCRQDMVKVRYQTFDELIGYCDLVATSISDISLPIFGYRDPAALGYGRNLAIALQLTNVTRDVGDDLERDRIYLPLEELTAHGITEEQLASREESDSMRRLLSFQIERAMGYFERAQPLLGMISTDARFPTLLMGSVYVEVLRRLQRDPLISLRRRLRLSTAEKIGVVISRLFHRSFL